MKGKQNYNTLTGSCKKSRMVSFTSSLLYFHLVLDLRSNEFVVLLLDQHFCTFLA